jgi:hypothetical protein
MCSNEHGHVNRRAQREGRARAIRGLKTKFCCIAASATNGFVFMGMGAKQGKSAGQVARACKCP